MSEIPTTYDKSEQRQVNAGNLLLRGVPGRRQDVLRRHPGRDQQREVRPHPGARRPAADRSRRLPDDQPVHRRARDRVRPDGVGGSHPARRDQPHPAEVAERVSRGPAGPHGHGRQDDLRAAGLQLRDCDDEPDRARAGHVSAVGSGDRPVRHHGQHRLPAAGRRTEARQLRLQARSPEPADVEGAHHRAARRDQRSRCFCTSASASTSSGSWRPRGPTTPTPTGSRARRPSSSSAASTSARRRARSSAGDGSRRSGRCCSGSGPRSIRRTSRIWRPTSWATASGSGPHAASHGLTTEAVIQDVIERVPIP